MSAENPSVWHQPSSDLPQSGEFFRALLGKTSLKTDAKPFGLYVIFEKGDQDGTARSVTTSATTAERSGEKLPWNAYIAVEDLEECANRALRLGGRVLVAPHEVPHLGRVCVIADPTGAVTHLVEPIQ